MSGEARYLGTHIALFHSITNGKPVRGQLNDAQISLLHQHFMESVQVGELGALEYCMKFIDCKDVVIKNGVRPLQVAAMQGNLEMVEFLLANSCNPWVTNDPGFVPVAFSKNVAVFLRLVEAMKASQPNREIDLNYGPPSTFTYLTALILSKSWGVIELLLDGEKVAELGLVPINWAGEPGNSDKNPLRSAITEGAPLRTIQRLLPKVNDFDLKDPKYEKLLATAIFLDAPVEVIEFLIVQGYEIEKPIGPEGYTVVCFAIVALNLPLVKLLVGKYKANLKPEKCKKTVYEMIFSNSKVNGNKDLTASAVNLLNYLKGVAGCDPSTCVPVSIFELALTNDRPLKMIKAMISSYPLSMLEEWRTSDGKSLLHLAALHNVNASSVAYFAQLFPSHLQVTDSKGFTPLHLAAGTGRMCVIRALLDAGANPDAKDCDGDKPSFVAQATSNFEAMNFLKSVETRGSFCFCF